MISVPLVSPRGKVVSVTALVESPSVLPSRLRASLVAPEEAAMIEVAPPSTIRSSPQARETELYELPAYLTLVLPFLPVRHSWR